MKDRIEVSIKFGQHKSDFDKLKRIMKDMEHFKVEAIDKDDAKRKYFEELERRIRAAGL